MTALVVEKVDAYRVRCTDCGNQVTGLFASEKRAEQAVEEKRLTQKGGHDSRCLRHGCN